MKFNLVLQVEFDDELFENQRASSDTEEVLADVGPNAAAVLEDAIRSEFFFALGVDSEHLDKITVVFVGGEALA